MSEETYIPPMLWVDLETTGLDEDCELPLEIAVVVTDSELRTISEFSGVIRQTIVLNDLDDWVLETHTKNGLFAEVVKAPYSTEEIDQRLGNLMRSSSIFPVLTCGDERPPLCGSTINFERRWLEMHFPEFYKHIHYRSIDVSSLKELMQRWMPDEAVSRRDSSVHRALPDVYDSIDELRTYRWLLWNQTTPL